MQHEVPPDVAWALHVVNAQQVADGVWHGTVGGQVTEIRAPWARREVLTDVPTTAAAVRDDADGS